MIGRMKSTKLSGCVGEELSTAAHTDWTSSTGTISISTGYDAVIHLFDQDLNTNMDEWDGFWVQYEYVDEPAIRKFVLMGSTGNKSYSSFDIQISKDGENWITKLEVRGRTEEEESIYEIPHPQKAKYIRIYNVQADNSDTPQADEYYFYKCANT